MTAGLYLNFIARRADWVSGVVLVWLFERSLLYLKGGGEAYLLDLPDLQSRDPADSCVSKKFVFEATAEFCWRGIQKSVRFI